MDIVGNVKTKKLMERMVASGKFANSYLFLGPEGTGKFKAAMFLAEKIINHEEKSSPDLILVAPETEEKNGVIKKRDIKIEAIRDLQHRLSLTSTRGGYKIALINEAERLNVTSQNALLKTLEEPNEKVILILVSQNEKKILPTIVSRCQKIRLGLANDVDIIKSLDKASDAEEIVFWSSGKTDWAHDLSNNKESLEYVRQAKKDLLAVSNGNIGEKFAMAETWSKDTNDLLRKMDLWLIFLRKVMLGKVSTRNFPPDKALRAIEDISSEMAKLRETNANARLILENLFLKI